MSDKQNPRLDKDEPSPEHDDEAAREKSGEGPRSYYYDDATGYEIYKEEEEGEEEDAQIDERESV
jgi:hypothetical protein